MVAGKSFLNSSYYSVFVAGNQLSILEVGIQLILQVINFQDWLLFSYSSYYYIYIILHINQYILINEKNICLKKDKSFVFDFRSNLKRLRDLRLINSERKNILSNGLHITVHLR